MRSGYWVTLVGLLATSPLAHAQTADPMLPWTSYLRGGPSWQAPVLQEATRGSTYQGLGCEAGWCRIIVEGREGFVPDRALHAPPGLRPGGAGVWSPTDCVGYLDRHARPARAELLCRAAQPG